MMIYIANDYHQPNSNTYQLLINDVAQKHLWNCLFFVTSAHVTVREKRCPRSERTSFPCFLLDCVWSFESDQCRQQWHSNAIQCYVDLALQEFTTVVFIGEKRETFDESSTDDGCLCTYEIDFNCHL